MLALPRLPAIPSASLVAVVHAALHPLPTTTSTPPLPTVLEAYLGAPCSAPLHRRAIHTGLNGTNDATRVLEVFGGWLEAFRERGETGSGWGLDGVTQGWSEDEKRGAQVGQVVVGKDVSLASVRRMWCAGRTPRSHLRLTAHPTYSTDPGCPSAFTSLLCPGSQPYPTTARHSATPAGLANGTARRSGYHRGVRQARQTGGEAGAREEGQGRCRCCCCRGNGV
jgi:hypothetical protein